MTQPRYNIYFIVHKALRANMAHVLEQLGACDWTDDEDTAQTLTDLRNLLLLCESHLQHENEFVHTAMESRAPGSTSRITLQHEDHMAAIAALREEAEATRNGSRAQRLHAGAALYHHFSCFVAENLEHMLEEETDNNAILWQHYSDDEIRAIEQALVASIEQPKKMLLMPWMLTATNAHERSIMLTVLHSQLPQPAFASILDLLSSRLPQREWLKLPPSLRAAASLAA